MSSTSKSYINKQNKYDRVVLLVDMDCFYCQVEEKLNPQLKGQPLAVVQYNTWRGGGIIAVNYAARAKGVTRHMRGDEAKEQCPEIQLVPVPNVREKADLTKYREAGKEVANVLQTFTQLLERASVDEAYLDITERVNERLMQLNNGEFVIQPQELISTYAVGYDNIGDYINVITDRIARPFDADDDDEDDMIFQCHDPDDMPAVRQSDIRLLVGASIASEVRASVKQVTGYECSAGIAHNKILAKLACGMNKPNKQTILPLSEIVKLFATLPVHKIKGLGAKFGEDVCQRLQVKFVGDLAKYSESELQKRIGEKNGSWLFNICRGIDLEAVTPRFYSKSIGCCKKFPGRNNICGLGTLKHWLNELSAEIIDRLEKDVLENNRKAKQMVVSYVQEIDGEEVHSSRSTPLHHYDQTVLAQQSLEVLRVNTKQFLRPNSDSVLNNAIKFLGISVGKFETVSKEQGTLQQMFANQARDKHKEQPPEKAKIAQNERPSAESGRAAIKEVEPTLCEDSQRNEPKSFFKTYMHSKSKDVAEVASNGEPKKPPTEPSNAAKRDEVARGSLKSFFANALKQSGASAKQLSESGATAETLSKSDEQIEEICAAYADEDATAELEPQAESKSESESEACSGNRKRRISEVLLAEERGAGYEQSYAEYGVPELRPELMDYVACSQCQVRIPNVERLLQEHQDHHFAQQLSQQQRVEFRAELKTRLSSSSSSTPTKAANTKKPKKASGLDITKFLRPPSAMATVRPTTPEPPSTSAAAQVLQLAMDALEACTRCSARMEKSKMAEHMDFHWAQDLHNELNRRPTTAATTTTTSTSSSKSKPKHAKPITQFFSQPNR